MNTEQYDKDFRDEISAIIWENYYSLSATPVEAMALIWQEYAEGNLSDWAKWEHAVDDDCLLQILSELTNSLRRFVNPPKVASDPQ